MDSNVFSHSWFLRRTLQLVFLTLVSLLLFCYLQFSIYCKTYLFSICPQTLERKYAFLIFNGILAFVAKGLVVQASPPMYVSSCEFSSAANLDIITAGGVVPIGNSIELEEDVIDQMVEEEPEQAHRDDAPEADHRDKEEDIAMDLEGEDSEEVNGSSEEKMWQEQEEEEERAADDDNEYLVEQHTRTTANEEYTSTDELNRRFEEFIRKMKEEIRIEAQRQLIVV